MFSIRWLVEKRASPCIRVNLRLRRLSLTFHGVSHVRDLTGGYCLLDFHLDVILDTGKEKRALAEEHRCVVDSELVDQSSVQILLDDVRSACDSDVFVSCDPSSLRQGAL